MKSIFASALLAVAGFAIRLQEPTGAEIADFEAEFEEAIKSGMTEEQIWDEAVEMYCDENDCSDFNTEDEELIKGHLAKMEGGDKKKGGKKGDKKDGKKGTELAQDADAKVEAEAKKMWKKMSKKEQAEAEKAIEGLDTSELEDLKAESRKAVALAQDADAKVEAEAKKMWKKMSKKEQAEAEKAIEGLDTSELEDLKAEARKEVKLAQKPAKGEKPAPKGEMDLGMTEAEIEAAIDEWCAENSCPDVDECASDDEDCFEAAMDAFCEDHSCSDNWSGDDLVTDNWSGDDVSGDEKPAPKGDKPAPKGDKPAPKGDKPAPKEE